MKVKAKLSKIQDSELNMDHFLTRVKWKNNTYKPTQAQSAYLSVHKRQAQACPDKDNGQPIPDSSQIRLRSIASPTKCASEIETNVLALEWTFQPHSEHQLIYLE